MFQQLFAAAREGDRLRADDVERLIGALRREDARALRSHDDVLLTYHGKAIRATTPGQRRYIKGIRNPTVTFCLGPAGTGKTYLAMAMAVCALQRRDIGRNVLTRPAVEAGENLGCLPVTREEMMDPSVLPLYDAKLDTLLSEDEVCAIAAHVLTAEGVERDVEISLSYVDEDEMHDLNRQWRDIDRTTDVLSFECDSAFDEDIPVDEVLELGDIILAPEVIARQAPGFGNDPADECRLMLVHGLLHLLGYDHIEDDEAEEMEAREDALLRELAVQRGDDPSKVEVGPITNHAHD